ncbi:stalk domain-containing protein [Paenibacillus alba]|uniref:Stalk domain-containing protein n=1 Tax=Paenibacillus alba TaxID=1197127 RepID=A0ABU6G905_9BACL|nr:stalk domain-containing protein [Paenibacillus alba]MEC0229303.1 stalk domain-containing protein [Paenibacillus alba]
MKKKLLIALGLSGIIAVSVAVGAYAASDIKLFVNGKKTEASVEIIDGSSYVPLKVVAEALGQEVRWDESKREIHIGKEEDTSSVGYSRSNPAPFNTKLTFKKESILENYEGEVSIKDVIRGNDAWALIKNTNKFNSPPAESKEYMLVNATVKITGNQKKDTKVDISSAHFTLVSTQGKDYDAISIVTPEPAINTSLYVGAENSGWFALQVDKKDTSPLITYARAYDGTGGVWFKTK